MTAVGVWLSLKVVKLARSAKSDAHLTLLAAETGRRSASPLRICSATTDGRYGRNEASSRRSSRAAWTRSVNSSLVAPFGAELVEHALRRLAALLGRRDGSDRARVPAVDAGEGRLQVQPAECPRQRPAPAVFLGARPRAIAANASEHQDVPLPPARMPVAAERRRRSSPPRGARTQRRP